MQVLHTHVPSFMFDGSYPLLSIGWIWIGINIPGGDHSTILHSQRVWKTRNQSIPVINGCKENDAIVATKREPLVYLIVNNPPTNIGEINNVYSDGPIIVCFSRETLKLQPLRSNLTTQGTAVQSLYPACLWIDFSSTYDIWRAFEDKS